MWSTLHDLLSARIARLGPSCRRQHFHLDNQRRIIRLLLRLEGDSVAFTIRPLTPKLWPAFEDLFRDSPVCSRCWCMAPRIGGSYRKRAAATNQAAFRDIVERGPPPGLLTLDDDRAVGWCQLTPRDSLPWLDRRAWRLSRVDDLPVWAISCFYVRKQYRRRGITSVLIAEALKAAKHARAPALEAYPLDREKTPSASSTGIVSTFARAGFREVARRVPPRPIMRHDLRGIGASSAEENDHG